MTKEFRNFLKKFGIYDNYIKNNKGESLNPYTYFDDFHWSTTEEGYDYWNYWDDVWLDILTKDDLEV